MRSSPQEETAPAKSRARCYITQLPGRKSKFFADGKLVARESISTAQQPVLGTPSPIHDDLPAKITSPTPTAFERSSRPLFRDTYARPHAWNNYHSPGGQSQRSAVSGTSSLDTFLPSHAPNDQDSILRRSPTLDISRVNSKSSAQDKHRATISRVLSLLEADHKESASDSDTADFDTVSLLSEYDIIDPVTTKSTGVFWEEIPAPPQTKVDVEPIDNSDCDDEDDEYYYESYFQSH